MNGGEGSPNAHIRCHHQTRRPEREATWPLHSESVGARVLVSVERTGVESGQCFCVADLNHMASRDLCARRCVVQCVLFLVIGTESRSEHRVSATKFTVDGLRERRQPTRAHTTRAQADRQTDRHTYIHTHTHTHTHTQRRSLLTDPSLFALTSRVCGCLIHAEKEERNLRRKFISLWLPTPA